MTQIDPSPPKTGGASRLAIPQAVANAARRTLLLCACSLAAVAPVAAQEKSDTADTRPAPLSAVVVSATRTEQSQRSLPSHVIVVGPAEITSSAAQTVQDLLRSIPGFTTRDFQAGMVSGPSQSIVSFRGLGGSSAGRALVLLDGIPAGDPFSGWLDWGRIPLPLLESAEVVRGGGSPIWGSRSLGGVVNLRTISPLRNESRLMIEGGSLGTYHATAATSVRDDRFAASIGGDFWNTDGFIVLRPDLVGPIDEPAAATSRALSGRATYDVTPSLQAWVGGGIFTGGDRPLGTDKRQDFDEGRGGLRWLAPSGGILTVALFGNRRTSTGSSWTINSERTTRTPQRTSSSPAHSSGLSLQWTQVVASRHELTVGADLSAATGSFAEQFVLQASRFTEEREVGGTQQIGGLFVQEAADLGAGVRLLASARLDRVRNTDGRRTRSSLVNGTNLSDSTFDGLDATRATGSLGLRWQQAEWLAWRGNVYEAFRAPSMYELYFARFSSRGTVTEANADLVPERLRGGEVGADITLGDRVLARVTAYRTRVASPILDLTVAVAGTQPQVIPPCGLMPARQTCGQRRNVDALQSNGLESELEWRPSDTWELAGAYTFSPTRVYAPGQPMDRQWAIRSPRHMANTRVGFHAPRWLSATLEGRYVGARYDDDLNTIRLEDFFLLGLRLNRDLRRGLGVHLKVENLLDESFEITRTRGGEAEMGGPRWITAGVRATW